ncbi:MAG: hypothetical protein IAF38_00880 [Bacteroidia bacterium]|nr:hypothetical protein [Bacteroidia bacterium]
MKKKECPSCAMMVSKDSKFCPICDYEFTSSGKGRKWVIIILLLLFLASAFSGLLLRFF